VTIFWGVLLGLVAVFWSVQSLLLAHGVRRLPRIRDAAPLPDADCPRVSIIFSARDEAEKLPAALATMLALDYPDYEVVAVNDRSTDATPEILEEVARRDARLRVLHVRELPPGWLGKPHGLQRGFEESTGDWLVFTDADVHFAPELLRRALSVALGRGWDHLTLLGGVTLRGFWETAVLTYFAAMFTMNFQPWRVSNPKSRRFMGVGSFQLVRRAAYELSGTHRRLAMEVIDDMKLGKILKQAGCCSGVGMAIGQVALRWHDGVGNIIRGTTKNFFAGANYRLSVAILQLLALFAISVLPFCALIFADSRPRAAAAIAALLAATIQGGTARDMKASPLYGLTHPLSALIFAYMLLRSTVVTLRQGGIVWRGTFYALEELRKGIV